MIPRNIVFEAEQEADGGYSAHAVDFPIFTQGDNLDELSRNIKEAVALHFEDNTDIVNFEIRQPLRA